MEGKDQAAVYRFAGEITDGFTVQKGTVAAANVTLTTGTNANDVPEDNEEAAGNYRVLLPIVTR